MTNIRVSVVISIYNSHKALARQTKYLSGLNLPDDIEFIFVDDYSNPPHNIQEHPLRNLRIFATTNKLAWTQGLGRNLGASYALGEYLFFTDIDHILSLEALLVSRHFADDKMTFP